MTSAALGALTLSMVINQVPVQGVYAQDHRPACLITAHQAQIWRSQGHYPVEQQVGQWCTVGTVINQYWVAEQWRPKATMGRQHYKTSISEGWKIKISLANHEISKTGSIHKLTKTKQQVSPSLPQMGNWGLVVDDPVIGTRLSVRRSGHSLEEHHRSTLHFFHAQDRSKQQATKNIRHDPQAIVTQLRQGGSGANSILVFSGRHPTEGSYSIALERATDRKQGANHD